MGYLWIFHTSRAARSNLVPQQSHPEPEPHFQDILVKQWHSHSQGELCPAVCHVCHQPCASTATAAWPGNAGLLHAQIPTHSPSHGWLLWLLSALPPQPPRLPPLPTAGRILFERSALAGGTALLPCEVPWKFTPCPAGKWKHFNTTCSALVPEMGHGHGKSIPRDGKLWESGK